MGPMGEEARSFLPRLHRQKASGDTTGWSDQISGLRYPFVQGSPKTIERSMRSRGVVQATMSTLPATKARRVVRPAREEPHATISRSNHRRIVRIR